MEWRRLLLTVAGSAAVLAIVAGCTSGSAGTSPPSATDTVTTTATDTVSAAAPPTGSGVPVTANSSASGGGTTGNGATSGPGLCTPTVATFQVGQDDAALGHAGFAVTVTNASRQACVTTGYPGVALLDAAGHQVEQAQRTPSGYLGGLTDGGRPATITLQPGEQATALIEGADSVPPNGTACPERPALLFTLPDNTDSTTLRHRTFACTDLQVHPLIKGTSGDA